MTVGRRRVLVVEDDASIRALLVDALSDEGYEVRATGQGEEGLALLRSWRPHAVLFDLVVPGLDAAEFRALQMDAPEVRDVPLLLLSATHADRLEQIAQELGAASFLAKPFDLDELLAAVARIAGG